MDLSQQDNKMIKNNNGIISNNDNNNNNNNNENNRRQKKKIPRVVAVLYTHIPSSLRCLFFRGLANEESELSPLPLNGLFCGDPSDDESELVPKRDRNSESFIILFFLFDFCLPAMQHF